MSAQAAIQSFCSAIGLPAQPPPLTLCFESSGQLNIECRNGFVFIYLTRVVPLHRRGVASAALRLVHPDRALPFAVRVAFYGESSLVLLVRVPEDRVDLSTLDAIAQLLTRLAVEAEEL